MSSMEKIPFNNIVKLGQRTMLENNLFSVSWILGRFCNYNCSYCWPYARSSKVDHRQFEVYTNAIDEIKRQLNYHTEYGIQYKMYDYIIRLQRIEESDNILTHEECKKPVLTVLNDEKTKMVAWYCIRCDEYITFSKMKPQDITIDLQNSKEFRFKKLQEIITEMVKTVENINSGQMVNESIDEIACDEHKSDIVTPIQSNQTSNPQTSHAPLNQENNQTNTI